MGKVTKESEKNVTVEWEYTDQRMSAGGYDEAYIEAYCNNPNKTKTECIIEAGYVGKHAKQQAYITHKRLRSEIEERLDSQILDGAHVGHNTLVKLCKDSESDTVKATCAKNLVEMAGRKAKEHVVHEKQLTEDERDEEIARLLAKEAEAGVGQKLDS